MTPAACIRTRAALMAAVGEGVTLPWRLDHASSAHLDVCPTCRSEAEGLALASHALRRFAAEADAVQLRAETWQQVQKRARHRRAGPLPTPDVVSIALAMTVVTAFVVRGFMPGATWEASDASDSLAPLVTSAAVDRRYDPPPRFGPVGPLVIIGTGPASASTELRLLPVALDRSTVELTRFVTTTGRDVPVSTFGFTPA